MAEESKGFAQSELFVYLGPVVWPSNERLAITGVQNAGGNVPASDQDDDPQVRALSPQAVTPWPCPGCLMTLLLL